MTAYAVEKHSGALKSHYSFGSASTNDVIIRAIKKAESSNEIIVRLNEGVNKSINGFTLELGEGIESARELYASEEYKGEAVVENGRLVCDFKPYEIKTFALTLKESTVKGKKPVCTPAKLNLDKNIITAQGTVKSDFDMNIPRELAPKRLTVNSIDFEISQTDNNCAVMCGQKIDISKSTDKLCLLCASVANDKEVEFEVDGERISREILSSSRRFAAWDLVDLGDVAYVKQGKIGFEATHCHIVGKDSIAKILYFYVVEIDVKGKKEVILPADSEVVVLAATEYSGATGEAITSVFDEVDKSREQTFYFNFSEMVYYGLCSIGKLGRKLFFKD